MDHLLNADNEEEVSQCVLERSLVLMGDLVFGEEGDVELCGYVTVGQQAGLILSILPIRTHKRTQTDPVEYARVRFTQRGSIGCKLTFGLSEVVLPQTVLMKHLEFVLPLFSTHPQPIIVVQSVCLSLIDCVVNSIDTTQPVSSLLSFSTSLTSMTKSVRLRVSHLVAQNLILSRPLISIRLSADLPLLMDSLSTGHSSKLSQTLPFSLPPSLSIESSIFESVSLRIDATHHEPIETGSVLFADLSLPLSQLSIRDCSFSTCSTVIISVPAESDLLLYRSSLLFSPLPHIPRSRCSIPSVAKYLSIVLSSLHFEHRLSAVGPDSVSQPGHPFLPVRRQTETVPACKRSGARWGGDGRRVVTRSTSSLPLVLFVSDHSTPSLSTRSCVFRFDTADPLNVGLAVVRVCSGAWPAQRNMLFVNCTSSRREVSRI
ncbi:hypothetical protein BLNAU_18807 [Blattamonas nauphoetae]|uniref:Uncharacterized protein n=1 Tax=Blattamonas nauphoetae TaxID=2049346 RepID=A0ABQ9X6P0_9EUKA|nr:hypothetical protein BLNAU_18807 [Blattamonas nauphoetae]